MSHEELLGQLRRLGLTYLAAHMSAPSTLAPILSSFYGFYHFLTAETLEKSGTHVA